MSSIVVFNWTNFQAYFSTLAVQIDQETAQFMFNRAEILIDNTDTSRIPYCPDATPPIFTRAAILNLATAHVITLNVPLNGQQPNPLVGRVASATQGSVSVQAEYSSQVSESQAFWTQTPYGAEVWQALAPFRMAIYRAPLPRAGYGGYGRGGRGW